MRTRLILSTLAFALAMVLAALLALAAIPSSSGNAQNAVEERLSALETRVAVLEEEVGIANSTSATSQSNQSSQQSNVSISSSQTNVSSSSGTGAYSASFTSSGDNAFEVDIDTAGTYSLTIAGGSAFTVELVGPDGNPVKDFSLVSSEAATQTATGELQSGLHMLRVEAVSMWSVTIISSES